MDQEKVPTTIMRGGTSKAIFLKDKDLPTNQEERDNLILRIFGSPDPRQIDGLGGADPLTSKLAIIGPPTREDADIDYTFGQVSYTAAKIDYSGNCGNVSSAVGPFAIDKGYVQAEEPYTTVRVHNTNTNKILIEKVPVVDGLSKVIGDYQIDGVPGQGAPISIDFSDTAGAKTGELLPTGEEVNKISTESCGEIEASLVDAGNPMVFVRAEDLGLRGNETPEEIDNNEEALKTLEEIRGKAAVMMGIETDWKQAEQNNPAFPMVAFVSPASDSQQESGIDFNSRLMFMQVMHKTYAGTGTICTGSAAMIKGTIVNQVMSSKKDQDEATIKIGHPAGFIEIEVRVDEDEQNGNWILNKAAINRTARRIMDGNCYIPKEG
ncbi:2-methylaconitate cis-trans isomerase PrpF family protein [Natranaerobius thermophilus]|uniref:Methylitaconate Delta-isomerase n=1 Tax=Natranaerobius thermophilus (strain ATCC BAA-1301 / DSM 18059 / JW/NM-WN-LF) TaxID=457570 RepID=B2A7L3_NATTJ|nr:PrpF domain-containing protein [Natranaerobius thermophilus]ACB85722.1 protein of unknown function DUF453 [Natranaerobius thermophilus JW/NM-WN-LF]